jgi:ABC-type uncharacterized transport system, periplasmic component
MRRGRALLGTLGLLALAATASFAQSPATAQTPRVYRIGTVLLGGPYAAALQGLRDGLKEQGFDEGKQYALVVRDTQGDLKAVGAAAKSLEAENVDVIFALGSSVAVNTVKSTQSVPIVFLVGADPVTAGLVENYRKPGGRATGVSTQSRDIASKRLELLKAIVPGVHRIVTFYNPNNPTRYDVEGLHAAARGLKIQLVERQVGSVEELRAALRGLRPGDADAIFWLGDAMVSSQAEFIIEIGLTKKLPTMLQEETSVAMGALASYGVSFRSVGHLAARHVHRILLGARPADLPVERLDRLHLAINLKTAKAIGVTVPQAVLSRADEVIQ